MKHFNFLTTFILLLLPLSHSTEAKGAEISYDRYTGVAICTGAPLPHTEDGVGVLLHVRYGKTVDNGGYIGPLLQFQVTSPTQFDFSSGNLDMIASTPEGDERIQGDLFEREDFRPTERVSFLVGEDAENIFLAASSVEYRITGRSGAIEGRINPMLLFHASIRDCRDFEIP